MSVMHVDIVVAGKHDVDAELVVLEQQAMPEGASAFRDLIEDAESNELAVAAESD